MESTTNNHLYNHGHCWSTPTKTFLLINKLLCSLSLWSLTNEIHKLIKLWSNDNLCTTVTLLTQL